MNILFLTKYTRRGASSRYRTFQYLSYLEKENINCEVQSFFNDKHIENINKAKSKFGLQIVVSILKRFSIFFKINKYDIVFIEKEIIPYFPSIPEHLLKLFNVKIILDYDDAVFHNYDNSKNRFIRFLFKNKIPKILQLADHIIVGSEYINEFALKFNSNITKIPTVISLNEYVLTSNVKNRKFIIGWIGSDTTSKYVKSVIPLIINFVEKIKGEIWLIGYTDKNNTLNNKRIKVIKWEKEAEKEIIKKFSVGISPLENSLFAKGKCAFKIIQYMAAGIPVVSSDVGENTIVINKSNNGFLVKKSEDWEKYLNKIYRDDRLRKILGDNGRKSFEENYTLESQLSKYLKIFKNLTDK